MSQKHFFSFLYSGEKKKKPTAKVVEGPSYYYGSDELLFLSVWTLAESSCEHNCTRTSLNSSIGPIHKCLPSTASLMVAFWQIPWQKVASSQASPLGPFTFSLFHPIVGSFQYPIESQNHEIFPDHTNSSWPKINRSVAAATAIQQKKPNLLEHEGIPFFFQFVLYRVRTFLAWIFRLPGVCPPFYTLRDVCARQIAVKMTLDIHMTCAWGRCVFVRHFVQWKCGGLVSEIMLNRLLFVLIVHKSRRATNLVATVCRQIHLCCLALKHWFRKTGFNWF